MDLTIEELVHINGLASDVARLKAQLEITKLEAQLAISKLEAQLEAQNAEIETLSCELDKWKNQAQMYESNNKTMMIENMWLKFILLRMDRVRDFFRHVDPVYQSFLLAFIVDTLPDNAPKDVYENVRNMLAFKDNNSSAPIIQHADQVNIDSKDITHTSEVKKEKENDTDEDTENAKDKDTENDKDTDKDKYKQPEL